jgi:AcrR family transcriptional regulator
MKQNAMRRTGKQGSRARAPARRRGARSDRMLLTALELFATQGFANVTIKDIARKTGMNAALIYYYYRDKEDLFLAALKHAINQALDRHGGLDQESADPVASIRDWFKTNERLFVPIGHMLKLMLDYRAAGARSASIQGLIDQFYGSELELLSRAIRLGVRVGVFRRVDEGATALLVSTHLDGLIVASVIRRGFNLHAGLAKLQELLFAHLGLAKRASARRRGAREMLRAA